ncbi:HARBI1 [Mytilus edulis]|uniref:Putative nuclease HARBI1 n=1 Tax=Mytilus edulis TaxID=6550 RepID=A0A8S3Q6I1_MYTED|nr:HARBI1 [Mytilus edulis]
MEEMLLFGNILHDPKPPRKYRKRLLTLDDLTDKELRARYRFGRNSIIRITDIVRKDIEHPTQRSQSLSAEMQVLVALRFFACGGFLQVVGDTLGIDKSTVSRCVQKVSDALNAKADQFIKWPSVQRKEDIKQGFFDNGKFTNVVARWPGSVHDSHIMRCSQVCTHLEESHLSVQDGLILGDSGYACRSFLMTPYLRPTEPCHEKFNKAHMKTRCCIERTFGWWKKRFNCLHQGIRMHPEKVCKIIMACAVLHNLAIEMKEPMDEYDNEIVNNDDLNIVFRGPDEGRIVRDHIARGFFS